MSKKRKGIEEFLESIGAVAPKPALEKELNKKLVSWPVVHAYLADLEPTTTSLKMMAHLLYMEYHGACRYYVMGRLYSRYNNFRRIVELDMLGDVVLPHNTEE